MSLCNPRTERETRAAASLARESTCPECDGDLLTDEDDARVCDECGLVVGRDDLDRGPNWYRDTEAEDRQTGPGRTVTRHDKGLSTQVGYQNGAFREIAETAAQASRLRELASRSKYDSKRERNLAHGFREIQRIATDLGLGESLQKQSCVLFETAQKNDLVIHSFGGWASFGSNRHQVVVILSGRKSILNPYCRTTGRAYEIAWILALLNTVVTLERRTQRELSRLVVRDQRRGNELNTLTRSNHRCVVHLAVDIRFQQEVGQPPNIVQEDREHEVE
jgi:hypothetical protein